ncbi:MAG: PIN domain-containing protein [Bacteroidia bacterium]|nr:PIN domain-containing protein [Sphingobacteriaceae bacterium]MBP9069119.1 PIN domain-containing protein [Bacteroidia bacterium]
MKYFLLDTNVIIDLLTDRRPFSLVAAKLLNYSEKGKVKIYLTAVSYNNTYYIVRKLTSHKETIKILKELESLTETIDTTKEAIKHALESEFKDFEDAIQYFSSKTTKKLDAIVTRNVADFKLSKISILTPEEAVGLIESADH